MGKIRPGKPRLARCLHHLQGIRFFVEEVLELMKKRFVHLGLYSALLALASLFWIAPSVNSQTATPAPLPQHQGQDQDNDTTRQELVRFDGFLDAHPEIAEELRRNPSLVNDREYVTNHPELQAYLQDHPEIREELKENPRAFMRQEDRFDRRDDDATRRELANFDGFLDKHPEIAEQLRKNPTLADDNAFLQNHPALQQFLQDHPGVRQQLAQDPRIFMRHEDDFDARQRELANFDGFLDKHPEIAEQLRKNPTLADNSEFLQSHPELQQFLQEHPGVRQQLAQDPRIFMRQEDGLDTNRRELANFDGFLDKHPEIAEQLRKNPTLADNHEFLQNHPALQQFLHDHPGVRQQLAQDPRIFMRQEDRFDRRDDDATRRELANFDGFLDNHREIAGQLSKDPSLAKNEEYLENHPELREYLQTHSGVREELAENPQAFMNSMKQFDDSGTKKEMADPKPKQ
jgi:phage-related protein